jgi:hypothetical protein
MYRHIQLAFATTIAIVTLASAVSGVAQATGTLSNATRSTVLTLSNLTLSDNVLGNLVVNVTLTATLSTGLIVCNLTTGRTIGGIVASNWIVTQPAGITKTGTGFPWPIITRCTLTTAGLGVSIPPSYILIGTPLGSITYRGGTPFGANLSPAGTSLTGTSGGAIPSDRGTTVTFRLPFAFTASPAVAWRLL